MTEANEPLVGIIMGSKSDLPTMENAREILNQFGVAHECRVVSAHRTPEWSMQKQRRREALRSLLRALVERLTYLGWLRH